MNVYAVFLLLAISRIDIGNACVIYSCYGCPFRHSLDCSQVTSNEDLERATPGNYSEIKMRVTPLTNLTTNAFGISRAVKFTVTLNKQLGEIQYGAFGIENLDITKFISLRTNGITSFPFDYMHKFTSLLSLDLYMNFLYTLPNNTEWPKTLQQLDIAMNKISSINVTCFASADSLRKIVLTANQLTLVPAGMQWPETLQELFLDSNFIHEIGVSSFITATGLKVLVLNRNPLASFPANMLWPQNLETLRMENTKISEINPFTFSAPWNLKHIDMYGNLHLSVLREAAFITSSSQKPLLILSGCEIQKTERNAFGDHTGGQLYSEIWLGWNNLTTFSEETFRSMLLSAYQGQNVIKIDIQGNWIKCDCSLKWLYCDGLAFGHTFKNQVKGLVCAENNKLFWELDESHFQHCL